jgi:glucosamine--fructose-6-phosphate aminotransferase (isomerizing)
MYMQDKEMAVITRGDVKVTDFDGNPIDKKIEQVGIGAEHLDKGDYDFFMLKEIYEQPVMIENIIKKRITEDNRIKFDELDIETPKSAFNKNFLTKVRRIVIQACGTSWHAGLVAKYWLERFAHIHTEVDVSSEFRYRNPIVEGDTLMLAISQSGETADTLAGIREAKSKFIKVLSLVNVKESSISRESDGIIPIMAGPEIGVASTKAYTAQLVNLFLFSLLMGTLNYATAQEEVTSFVDELKRIPYQLRKLFTNLDGVMECAEKYYTSRDFIFLARGWNYPNAMEGALKLKELSYIHTTGYPAGEFKHGPIALIHDKMPVVCINPLGELYPKMLSNIEEVNARKGIIIAVASDTDTEIQKIAKHVIQVPFCNEVLSPVLTVVPLQLLAYHIAVKLGYDVDKPRNLAKSVTVE